MRFRVQNLGPLREAEVDLSKDLIVLAGPNNSGKTYLAWSVYGLHRMRPTPKVDLSAWARKLVESPEHSIDLNELFAQEGEKILEDMGKQFQAKLHLCFSAPKELFAGARIVLTNWSGRLFYPDKKFGVIHQDANGRFEFFWRPTHPTHIKLEKSELTAEKIETLTERFQSVLGDFSRVALFPGSTLFPAERIAVNIFAKELALERTKLVDEMIDADLEGHFNSWRELIRQNVGRYPWPIRDSLRTANDVANLRKQQSPFSSLADELETQVLKGRVRASDDGELIFSPQSNDKAALQMHLTASVVKSLSSLVFYFRHLAQEGDFLIIDEPELNLHPDNQRIITRILAKAVRLGFKIMMSTHSDYVLRELNHLIMLNNLITSKKLPEDEVATLGYDPQSAIDPNRMGVYLFNEQTAQPVPIGETGFFIKTIDDVVDKLNHDAQRLYTRIFDD